MKNLLFFLILLTACIFSCKKTEQANKAASTTTTTTKIEAFSSRLDSLIRQGGGPCESDFDCMKIKAVWPIVTEGDKLTRKILNDSIAQYMLDHMAADSEAENMTLSKAMDAFIADFAEEFKTQNTNGLGWSLEAIGKIDFHQDIANIQIDNYSFFGGAHPNYYSQYANFNTKTGKILGYSDIVKDMDAFSKLVEEEFATAMKEKTGDDDYLSYFGESGFTLAKNFKIAKEGLEILYNPYEAGPYVLGSTEVILPYSKLKDLVKL